MGISLVVDALVGLAFAVFLPTVSVFVVAGVATLIATGLSMVYDYFYDKETKKKK